MKKSLKTRLLEYLRKQYPNKIASGELQRIVMQNTTYSPANVTRQLRYMENEGLIDVSYIKNHAWYVAKAPQKVEHFNKILPDGTKEPFTKTTG